MTENLKQQIFNIMEDLLSCGSLEFEEDRNPQLLTQQILENFQLNSTPQVVEEIIKEWLEINKDLDFENLPN